jgi:sugar phosphate isomerase/epimerase
MISPKSRLMNRRTFLQTTAAAVTASVASPFLRPLSVEAATTGPGWPIGCFNRPWVKWPYDVALDGIKEAGYNLTGLLSRHPIYAAGSTTPIPGQVEAFAGAEATPEYLESLRKRIAARGLGDNMCALRNRFSGAVADVIRDVRVQIDHAKALSLEFALTFGVANPSEYENFFQSMTDAAAYAQERGVKLVMKPHGGSSGSSEEILQALKKVNHPNFKIWYDAGNIIYYTGKDPVADLDPIAEHVTGFCAKDCLAKGGEVMIQFGEGKVDFTGVFKKLKAAGFNGPIMVEGVAVGATPEETTANARKNREFLERTLASI